MINSSKLKILIILLVLGLAGGILGAFFSLRSTRPNVGIISLSEDLAVRQVAGNYLQAWQDEAPDKMYVFLSSLDKEHVTVAEYKRHFEAFPVAPLHFKLGTVKLADPERAIIKVRITWPELEEERFSEKEEQLVLVKEAAAWRIREEESLN